MIAKSRKSKRIDGINVKPQQHIAIKEKYAQDGEHDEELHTHHDDKRRTQRVLGEKSSDAIKSLLHESQK